MTWTKISDDHFDRPEVIGLSRSASLLHVEVMVWCNRLLTDGALPRVALSRCTSSPDPDADADELVKAGLWEATPEGWRLDWSDQRPAEVVLAERAENRRRQDIYRERGRRHARGDHSACSDKCPARRNAVTNGVSNGPPVPSRPVPTDREGSKGIGLRALKGSTPGSAWRPPRPSPTARTAKREPIGASEIVVPGEGSDRPCNVIVTSYEAEDEHIEIVLELDYPTPASAQLLRRLNAALTVDMKQAKRLHRCPRTEGNREICAITLDPVRVIDEEGQPGHQLIEMRFVVPAEFSHAWLSCIRWELDHGLASEPGTAEGTDHDQGVRS